MDGAATATARLETYLSAHHVLFELHAHRPAYTAQEVAAAEHRPGRFLAKVVMVVAAGELSMLVIPATHRLDWRLVAATLGTDDVHLADEEEFAGTFPDCEVGAMPPFGNLYGVPVYVDRALAKDESIDFPAGSHRETLRLKFVDFERLVEPRRAALARHE